MAVSTAFGAKTEGTEVVQKFSSSIKGKTILITGVGPNGLGETLCLLLASQGADHLIITGRSLEKVSNSARAIKDAHPSVEVTTLELDLASLDSVRHAAKEVNKFRGAVDILINNAGVMNIPERTLSKDGFEMHLATNHLGPFAFTNLVLAKILASSKSPRIVNIVSNGYALSPFRFSDWNFDGQRKIPEAEQPPKETCKMFGVPWGLDYIPPVAYGQSKTAGILFTKQLSKRLQGKATVICLNPGAIDTDLWRQMPREVVEQVFAAMPPKSKLQGASTPLVAALDPQLTSASGAYLNDCQVEDVAEWAKDPRIAEKCWAWSAETTKLQV
ncbi:MAG: hypothetical protein LQ351_003589 [Letrouitia transgressa]|nr:MAG: hypothetical protein LQ351_003589 [Letrouitia transgressa]